MTSEVALREFTTIIRERLLKYGQLSVSGLGTLKIESIPSMSERPNDNQFILHPPKRYISLDESSSVTTDLSLVSEFASNQGISHEDASSIIDLLVSEIIAQAPIEIPTLGVISRTEDKLHISADPELATLISGTFADMDSLEILPDSSGSPAKGQRRVAQVAMVVLIVGALAVGGYFLTNWVMESNQQISEPLSAVLPANPDPVTSDSMENNVIPDPSDSPANMEVANGIVANPVEPSTDAIPSEQPDTNNGSVLLDREAGGYTIIVGSFNTPEQAQAVVERYRTSLPGMAVDTLVSDDSQYRVALGQFPSIPDAVAAISQLDEIPSDAWVKNVRNVGL